MRARRRDVDLSESFYLTEPGATDKLMALTDLSMDEIENIVGRFRQSHYRWAGLLKGQVVVTPLGETKILHHFKKTILWQSGE